MTELLVEVYENEYDLMNVLSKMNNVKNIRNLGENYSIPGNPMSIATFKQRITHAEQDILKGKTYTTEEARKMIFGHTDD